MGSSLGDRGQRSAASSRAGAGGLATGVSSYVAGVSSVPSGLRATAGGHLLGEGARRSPGVTSYANGLSGLAGTSRDAMPPIWPTIRRTQPCKQTLDDRRGGTVRGRDRRRAGRSPRESAPRSTSSPRAPARSHTRPQGLATGGATLSAGAQSLASGASSLASGLASGAAKAPSPTRRGRSRTSRRSHPIRSESRSTASTRFRRPRRSSRHCSCRSACGSGRSRCFSCCGR